MKIKDFMSKKIILVGSRMSVKELIRILEENKINGAPVVDAHGKLVGVISASDVIQRSDYISRELANTSQSEESYEIDITTGRVETHKYYTQELFDKNIECLMTKEPISLSPEDDIDKAIKIFLSTPIHRIIIMEKDKVVGIISAKDTLKALATIAGRGV